jgi:hypothetical protein
MGYLGSIIALKAIEPMIINAAAIMTAEKSS